MGAFSGDAPHAETFSQGGTQCVVDKGGVHMAKILRLAYISYSYPGAAARVLDDMFAQMLTELMRR